MTPAGANAITASVTDIVARRCAEIADKHASLLRERAGILHSKGMTHSYLDTAAETSELIALLIRTEFEIPAPASANIQAEA